MKIQDQATFTALEKHHALALQVVSDVFRLQSQTVVIETAVPEGFSLSMRVNLPKQQADRLLVAPLNENLHGYTVVVDHPNKRIILTRHAAPKRTRKPAANAGKTSG